MKRIIDHYLLQWKHDHMRKPLLLRGARQVGKTYTIRQLGKTYESFVEINLEDEIDAHIAFEKNLDPEKMIVQLMAATGKKIIPGKTLLFLDEIQAAPRAITALRYFYEKMPELHVIAAGSLLDFAIQQVGIPVGRIESIEMHPVSFIEYLASIHQPAIDIILNYDFSEPQPGHTKFLDILGEYLAIGGMPESIQKWIHKKQPLNIAKVHTLILKTYRQDFNKYAKNHEIKYVEKIFNQIPKQLGKKFKYSIIEGNYRKRELAPAMNLLENACIAHKIHYSSGQDIPLAAQSSDGDYKVIFIDIGLAQTSLGLNLADWLLQPQKELVDKNSLVEAFVGQELAVYRPPYEFTDLYYWHKDGNSQQIKIDYLITIDRKVIPIEIRLGVSRTLKNLNFFLETHPKSPYGIKFPLNSYSINDNIHSYPLYAIGKIMTDYNPEMLIAIKSLAA